MYFAKRSIAILLGALFCASFVLAQENRPVAQTDRANAREVTIIIEQQQLRFIAPASTQEFRLEVFNKAGESVYDSGLVTGQELSWNLRNASGEDVPSGLYAYTVTVKEANSETPAPRRGHLILEGGRDRIWVTNQGAIGAEESLGGAELTVSSTPERSVAGTRIGRASSARSTLNLDFFGTPGRIPMFTGSDFLADSVINQDFNGNIGIGTTRPGTALLTVGGQIETTSGGIKFPNGTVQTTSAAGALFQVSHDTTLTGNGTPDTPLGVAIPLILSGSSTDAILKVTNTKTLSGGAGVSSTGPSSDNGFAGSGLVGVGGNSATGFGGAGIIATAGVGAVGNRIAGRFNGDVIVTGNLSKGGGSFKIDHPLDPANKYLYHSFVESPDMMNVYNGNIATDQNGEATVTLPDYFEALNRDFRYQLTVIGQFAQAIVASEINGNRFTIKTDRPGVKVSWQVTGIRQDAYANKYRIPVEEEKSESERGFYLHPEVFKQPEEKSLEWARDPELMRQIKRQRDEAETRRREKENDR